MSPEPLPPVEEYHVAWICALPSELAAALAMLDEEYERICGRHPKDCNSYVLGRIHKHNVVLACLPAGSEDTNAATKVATNLSRTFPSVRFGLLVGVGGGIPDPQKNRDVRLGDVVVSEPGGLSGGVIQYDKGKLLGNGCFERKGSLNAPPAVLLNAVNALQAEHMRRDSWNSQYMKELMQKWPKMHKKGYTFPEHETDILRCTHHHGVHTLCEACENGVISRPPRETRDPEIHYGVIASGNMVIKNASERDRLHQDYKAICVETEAAGLMNNFPCLVVRGICDYADCHKNDKWQNYAAATAAAYAKELLYYVSPEQASRESSIQSLFATHIKHAEKHLLRQGEYINEQQIHNKRQEAHNQKIHENSQTEKQLSCHRNFHTSLYSEQKDFNPKPAPGTCRWVLEDPEYKEWRDAWSRQVLWISADPGCGKSVLSKHLVDTRFRNTDQSMRTDAEVHDSLHTVCYFFFKDNSSQDSLAAALCAVLHQLFTQQSRLISHALDAHSRSGDRLMSDVGQLWRIFMNATHDPDALPTTCVFDALDECKEVDQRRLIEYICSFHTEAAASHSRKSKLKILITSRPYYEIEADFEKYLSPLPSIRVQGENKNDVIKKEIDLVVNARVEDIAREHRLSPATTERLEGKLLAMDNRTYLWLHLVIEDIRTILNNSIRPELETFSSLPTSVEQAYESLLDRGVKESKRDEVRTILRIIVGSRRALTIGEMAIALDLATAESPPEEVADLVVDPKHLKRKLRNWCGLFIFFNHDRIYLLHQTAKDFLLSHPGANVSNSGHWKHSLLDLEVEKEMARICILFLGMLYLQKRRSPTSLVDPEAKYNKMSSASSSIRTFHPFVTEYWAQHVRSAADSIDRAMHMKLLRLYEIFTQKTSREDKIFCEWKRWSSYTYRLTISVSSAIEFAAFNGHKVVLESFINEGVRSQFPDILRAYNQALVHAAGKGFQDIVLALLAAGANVNANYDDYGTALRAAASAGHPEIVGELLKNGAYVNATSKRRGSVLDTALSTASQGGHERVVEVLLASKPDVNALKDSQRGPLAHAAFAGHVQIVEMLLEANASVRPRNGQACGALLDAVKGRHAEIVQLLLDRGASVNSASDNSCEALVIASANGDANIVEMLLEADAVVNADGGQQCRALAKAFQMGHVEIVDILLKAGAFLNMDRGLKCDALQWAASHGHAPIVHLLLNARANVDAWDEELRHAVMAATTSNHAGIAQTLLSAMKEPSALLHCVVALHEAAYEGYDQCVQILHCASERENARESLLHGGPLPEAITTGSQKLVKLLLDQGAALSLRDGSVTDDVLKAAARSGNVHALEAVLDARLIINKSTARYTMVRARSKGHDSVAHLLWEAGY